MYACLHVPAAVSQAATLTTDLQQLALQFSPLVEITSANTVMFCITPLRRLIGSPHQIASEICRYGYERNLRANLAIASNPDTAVLLASYYTGVTLVTPGEEHFHIAPIPLATLSSHGGLSQDPALLDVLRRWGLKTCEDLAALPEKGIAERLGSTGVYLRNLAMGRINRPLRVPTEEISYERRVEVDHPISLLEPLLFLFSSTLTELCGRLRSQSRSARVLQVKLELAQPTQLEESTSPPALQGVSSYECALEFPVPVDKGPVMLKLLQLHMERHPPAGAVTAFTLRLDPVEPQRLQGGLFLPATPQADKLHVTLKRIEGMVGEGNVGVPELLNTHRPDAFRMSMHLGDLNPIRKGSSESPSPTMLRLALRLFRPALHARVRLADLAPKQVVAPGVQGAVVESAGPWKTSGDWWTLTPWVREEWDVALDDGALYRIYCELQTREWYVHAVYD